MKVSYNSLYLSLLPLFGLSSVVLSALRISDGLDFVKYFLLTQLILDFFLILFNFKKISLRYLLICLMLLIPPLIIGITNNDLSRRHVTDFFLPLIFFVKISIFARYWQNSDLKSYIVKYSKITIFGSAFLLVLVYFVFDYYGASRISILAPLEVGASFYFFTNPFMFLLALFLCIAYGKRAQLVSLAIAFITGYKFIRKRLKFSFALIFIFLSSYLLIFSIQDVNNLSLNRLVYSFELLINADFERLSAGRFGEIFTVIDNMQPLDYIFGKGTGVMYQLVLDSGDIREFSNVHFSPLGLISKYGLPFTLFVYLFFAINLLKIQLNNAPLIIKVVYFSVLIIFLESFFSYSLFTMPILPVLISVLLNYTKKSNAARRYNAD